MKSNRTIKSFHPITNILHRLLLTAVGIAVMLALLAAALIHTSMRYIDAQTIKYCQSILSVCSANEQSVTEGVKNIFDSMAFDNDLFRLVHYSSISSADLLNGLRQLKTYRESNAFIDSVYVYNAARQTVYVSSPNAMEAVWSLDDFYDTDATAVFRSPEEYQNMEPISRQLPFSYPKVGTAEFVTYIRYNTLEQGDRSVVMINVKKETYLGRLRGVPESLDADVFVLDSNGNTVLSQSGDNGGPDVTESERRKVIVDRINGMETSDEEAGNITYQYGGKQYIACVRPAFGGYWHIVFSAERHQLQSVFQTGRFFLFIAMDGLVSTILIILFARTILQIRHIHEDNQHRLKEAEEEHRQVAFEVNRRKYLDYLHGIRNVAEVERKKINPEETVRIFLIQIRHYETMPRDKFQREKDKALLKFSICNVAEELLQVFRPLFSVYEEDGRCIVVMHENPQESLTEAAAGVIRTLKELVSVEAVIFVSEPFILSDLAEVYRNLNTLRPYRQINDSPVLMQGDLDKLENVTASINQSHLNDLRSALKEQNSSDSISKLQDLLHEVARGSYASFQNCAVKILTALDDDINSIAANNTVSITHTAGSIIFHLEQYEHISEIVMDMAVIINEITDAVSDKKDNRKTELVRKIEEIVHQNYMDVTFSVTRISDELSMSSPYIGRLFRQLRGETLVSYILKVRLSHACEQLVHTEQSIEEVALDSGFSDVSYFYRVFRRAKGCTPAQYRAKYGGK